MVDDLAVKMAVTLAVSTAETRVVWWAASKDKYLAAQLAETMVEPTVHEKVVSLADEKVALRVGNSVVGMVA